MSNTIPASMDLIAFLLGAVGFVLFPIEMWQRWRRGRLSRSTVKEMAASASPFVGTLLFTTITTSFILVVWRAASVVSPFAIPTTWYTALLALLLVDFLYYIDHRAGHRVRLYWATAHSVHHSSPQYDQTTGLRVSFLDGFISPWFYVPAVFIGFDPLLVGSCFGVILLYQQWLHTESIGKLRWFDGWLNTPSNHRVHHGTQPEYLDKNYGAVLMIWDRMFGTYEPERAPVSYGLTDQINSVNPLVVHTAEAVRMIQVLRGLPSLRDKAHFMFGPPSAVPPQ
jgi:sterol desaturase/sphingolipid hydroxylase (fatty acid hydroxylase superfamily)